MRPNFPSLTMALVICISCSPPPSRQDGSYILREVRRFGEVEDEMGSLAGAPVLSAVRGVAQGLDSAVYILDRDF
jgi:hypothetical protein